MTGFLPLLLVCTLGFTGTPESSPACAHFYDLPAQHYHTPADCLKRLYELKDAVLADSDRLEAAVPGPWQFIGRCTVEVLNELIG